jgi:hypothetical protein
MPLAHKRPLPTALTVAACPAVIGWSALKASNSSTVAAAGEQRAAASRRSVMIAEGQKVRSTL